jgi:hypothetical protein
MPKKPTPIPPANLDAENTPITWKSAATAIGLAIGVSTAISGAVFGAFKWIDARLDERYERRVEADAKFNEVVSRFTVDLAALRAQIDGIKHGAQRNIAWLFVGQARQEMMATRNRVNDCRAKKADRRLQPGEVASCMQYEDELVELTTKLRDATKSAQDASK